MKISAHSGLENTQTKTETKLARNYWQFEKLCSKVFSTVTFNYLTYFGLNFSICQMGMRKEDTPWSAGGWPGTSSQAVVFPTWGVSQDHVWEDFVLRVMTRDKNKSALSSRLSTKVRVPCKPRKQQTFCPEQRERCCFFPSDSPSLYLLTPGVDRLLLSDGMQHRANPHPVTLWDAPQFPMVCDLICCNPPFQTCSW